jgi:hypothetical protein
MTALASTEFSPDSIIQTPASFERAENSNAHLFIRLEANHRGRLEKEHLKLFNNQLQECFRPHKISLTRRVAGTLSSVSVVSFSAIVQAIQVQIKDLPPIQPYLLTCSPRPQRSSRHISRRIILALPYNSRQWLLNRQTSPAKRGLTKLSGDR